MSPEPDNVEEEADMLYSQAQELLKGADEDGLYPMDHLLIAIHANNETPAPPSTPAPADAPKA